MSEERSVNMEKIRGALDVELTVDEITSINALIERATAKAVIVTDMGNHKCPVCKEYVSKDGNFCSCCGQMLDNDNVAF